MWALLCSCLQQGPGDGSVVGHDGNVQGQQPLAVGGVEVQLLGAVLLQQLLHPVQVLQLHGLEERSIALELDGGRCGGELGMECFFTPPSIPPTQTGLVDVSRTRETQNQGLRNISSCRHRWMTLSKHPDPRRLHLTHTPPVPLIPGLGVAEGTGGH